MLGLSEVDAQLIGAIATFGGVAVALWIALYAEDRRAEKRRPSLSIEVTRPSQSTIGLKVRNAAGKDTAQNVEVLVIDLEHHPSTQISMPPKHATSVSPVNSALAWSDGSIRINIQPGLQREIKVAEIRGMVGKPEQAPIARIYLAESEVDAILTLAAPEREYFLVRYFADEVCDSPARLRLALIADNVTAAYYTLEIGWPWDAPWWDQASFGAFTSELKLGHTARSPGPLYVVPGGPWANPDELPPPNNPRDALFTMWQLMEEDKRRVREERERRKKD